MKFKEWYTDNYREGYVLDKDLLIEGNRIYSEDTCLFVPNEINSIVQSMSSKNIHLNNSGGIYARFSAKGVDHYLGTFDSVDDATIAYKIKFNQMLLSLISEYSELKEKYEARKRTVEEDQQ